MKKGIFAVLLAVVAAAAIYSVSHLVQSQKKEQQKVGQSTQNIENQINALITKRQSIPYQLGRLMDASLGWNESPFSWKITQVDGQTVHGEFLGVIPEKFSIPTLSQMTKSSVDFKGQTFDYGSVKTTVQLENLKLLASNDWPDDLKNELDGFKKVAANVNITENTYIKKTGELFSILDISPFHIKEYGFKIKMKGFQKTLEGNLLGNIYDKMAYQLDEVDIKTDEFKIKIHPFQGELVRSSNQYTRTLSEVKLSLDIDDDDIMITLAPSIETIDIVGQAKGADTLSFNLGTLTTKPNELNLLVSEEKVLALKDFIYTHSILENAKDKETYDVSMDLSSKITIDNFNHYLKSLFKEVAFLKVFNTEQLDNHLTLSNISFSVNLKGLSKDFLTRLANGLNFKEEELKEKDLLALIESVLSETNTSAQMKLVIGSNKGDIKLSYDLKPSQKASSINKNTLSLNDLKANKLLKLINMEIDLSIDESLITALAIEKNQLGFLAISGLINNKEGKLSSYIQLKDGVMTINEKEVPLP